MSRRATDDRHLADYALALDMVSRMGELTSEAETVEHILDLFVEICAPRTLAYLTLQEGESGELYCRNPGTETCDVRRARLASLDSSWAWTPSGHGFLLRIERASETVGVLEVDDLLMPEHRQHYLNLALAIEGVLGLAVSNARNFEGLEAARRATQEDRDAVRGYLELSEALNRINETIGSTLDFDEIMRRVVVRAAWAMGADMAGVFHHGEEGWSLRYSYGFPAGMVGRLFAGEELPIATRAERERRTIVSHDLVHDTDASRIPDPLRAMLSVVNTPIILKDELIGVLSFRAREPHAFSAQHIDFASKIASTLALALENARLFQAKRAIADTLQQALLEMPEHVRGVTFGYRYHAATRGIAEVGGDFYELFPLHDDLVGILIGDVAGKGLGAAKATSLVKDTVRAFATLPESPADILTRTNAVVSEQTLAEVFVTVFFGLLDVSTGRLVYCSAGHPPALVRKSGETLECLQPTSPILGSLPDAPFENDVTVLDAEDVLVLYTDGATEARRGREFFGEKRLWAAVATAPREPQDMADALLRHVETYTEGHLADDLALLCVKRARQGEGG